MRALSSAGLERLPYKQRVGGSNPSAPTEIETLHEIFRAVFRFCVKNYFPNGEKGDLLLSPLFMLFEATSSRNPKVAFLI